MAHRLLEDILEYAQKHPIQVCAAAVSTYFIAKACNTVREMRVERDDAIISETQTEYDPYAARDLTDAIYAA